MDDLQGASHLEMTLRKVGFDVEIITNEFHLSEKLLGFNPDYILVKGSGPRLSTLSVGKKLKENLKYNGKVILIFPQNNKPSLDELIQIRMDLLLFDPVSAIRLVAQLLLMTTSDKELIADKLMRLANTDQQFRQVEMQLLGGGASIENEIQMVVSKLKQPTSSVEKNNEEIDDDDILSFINPELAKKEPIPVQQPNGDTQISEPKKSDIISDSYKNDLLAELIQAEKELALKIVNYKKETNQINIDMTIGHSKKITKKANRELYSSLANDEMLRLKRLDKEKQEFARALFTDEDIQASIEKTSEARTSEKKTNNYESSLEAELAAMEAELKLANKQGSDE